MKHPSGFLRTYWCNKYGVRIIFYSKEGDFALVGKETKNDIDGVEYDGKASASDNNTLTFWLRSEDDTANSGTSDSSFKVVPVAIFWGMGELLSFSILESANWKNESFLGF